MKRLYYQKNASTIWEAIWKYPLENCRIIFAYLQLAWVLIFWIHKINPEGAWQPMIRKTKGTKRYSQQRERLFTDNLIREDEMQRVKEAQRRLSRFENAEDGEKIYIERKHPR